MKNKNVAATSLRLKVGLAEMLKGRRHMDVMNVEQARIAEGIRRPHPSWLSSALPARSARGRRSPHGRPGLIKQIIQAVSIPVMPRPASATSPSADLQELGVDFIDESESSPPRRGASH